MAESELKLPTQRRSALEDGLPSDDIRALADAPDGVVWIATDAGIARFVPSRGRLVDQRPTSSPTR